MILERYIHSEILSKLIWIIGLLILILASQRFVGYLADAAEGRLPGNLLFDMLGMKMLSMTPKLLPVALFVSVILAMSRLNRDRELTVVSSAGVADRFQIHAVLRLALVYSLLVAGIAFYLAPWAELRLRDLNDIAKVESDVTGLRAGQFKEFSRGNRVVYVQKLTEDRRAMGNVFVQVRQPDGASVVKADSARYQTKATTGSRYVVFHNGRRYIGAPGKLDYRISHYRTYGVLLEQGVKEASARRLEAYPTSELWRLKDSSHVPDRRRNWYKTELQWRLSYVLTSILLPLLGVALCRAGGADQRYTPLLIAILIYFIYSNLLGISKTLMVRQELSIYTGLWWVHGLLAAVILVLLKEHRIRFWYRRLSKRARQA
jgi:lipopolysaccharide export system permease protein